MSLSKVFDVFVLIDGMAVSVAGMRAALRHLEGVSDWIILSEVVAN